MVDLLSERLETTRVAGEPEPSDFVLDLLGDLRAATYHPGGWLRFFVRAWQQSHRTARDHPQLVASWARITTSLALAEGSVLALEAAIDDPIAARRAAPGAALWLAAAQFDAYIHFGMNHTERGDPLHNGLGIPTMLTLARRSIASLLWGHLLGRRTPSRAFTLAALLAAGATDIADGALARRTGRTTRLGGYLDGVADFEFWSALAITLSARRLVPRWLLPLLLIRWIGPLGFALASYFGWINRVPIGSTITGKAAAVAQAVTLGAALLPTSTASAPRRKRLAPALHAATALLLVAAPFTQLRKILRSC